MGFSTVRLDYGSSVSANESDWPEMLSMLSRASNPRLPRACRAPSQILERPAVAGRSWVEDCEGVRLVQDRTCSTGFSSDDGFDKSLVSSGPK